MVQLGMEQGWDVVVLTFRGLAGPDSALQSPHLTCAADRLDANALMKRIGERTSEDCVRVAVGYSMGGNILVNHLARYHSNDPKFPQPVKLHGAVSVSNPFHFPGSCNRLHGTFGGTLMSRNIANGLKLYLRRNLSFLTNAFASTPVVAPQESMDALESLASVKNPKIQFKRKDPSFIPALIDIDQSLRCSTVMVRSNSICHWHSLSKFILFLSFLVSQAC
jgi:predicted alpha/beta-fold hydrolase